MKFMLVIISVIMTITSCASTPASQSPSGINRVIELINRGHVEALTTLSSTPFLLDREILMTSTDVVTFWNALKTSRFSSDFPQILDIRPLSGESEGEFSSSWEEGVFLRKHIPDDAALIQIRTGNREFTLILGGNRAGYPRIYGFKGPVS